ncbi:hypothetical protein F0562_031573 [Nyssa sinensis]|uniref:F-box domain-containing protein n=1 Tax=Nyssa sinensis TaxID=561372 RepID=A0A5J5AW09_9ASTE|nr:hypothetical protein F0562_031573 [Nyssa sinensis]
MASSTHKQDHLPNPYGTTAAPPPTPSTQPSPLSSSDAADTLARLLHRLPPTLSLPIRRRPLATCTPPLISLSDPNPTLKNNLLASSELGFFQLTNHSIPSQLALSAESESLSLFNLPHDKKQLSVPKNWPLGYDYDDDDDDSGTGESFCFDSSCSTESTELSLTSLGEFTREMEKVGLDVIQALSCPLGFENPARVDPTKVCSLMWISEGSPGIKPVISGRFYPYIVGLQYQIRCQKYSLLADSGWVSASPQVDSVLVTLGDIGQVWSNGKLKKVRGRPVPSLGDGSNARCITMSLLVTLPIDSIVSPLVTGLNVGGEEDGVDKDDDSNADSREDRLFNSFSFEDYAWRIYHERLPLKDPLDRYRFEFLPGGESPLSHPTQLLLKFQQQPTAHNFILHSQERSICQMGRRVRLSQHKGGYNSDDRISQLPDDIIISILSRLPLKEAVFTSVLSRRWRYLWTCITGLSFDSDEALDKIATEPKSRNGERPKYINWVNRVMRQHTGPTIDEFRICFDLDRTSKCAIDRWIKFAVAKRVQKLELDLLENGESLRQPSRNYTFPYKLVGPAKGSSLKHPSSILPGVSPSTFAGFKSIKFLSFKCVNVSGEVFEYFLSNCPVLQYLSIHGSGDLVNVRVAGPTLMLKYLEIVFCLGIETIEICDTNLISFSYLGPGINLLLSNVPMLDEISIGEGFSGFENNVFYQISCCLSHLEILTLDIYRPEENIKLVAFPEFPKLKQLILKVGAWDDDSLLEFTSLIKACPCLQRFVLQLIWMSPSKRRKKMRKAAGCPHQYLKLVEMVGYYGRISDVELAMYFIENAIALQKIVIDPRNQILERTPVGVDEINREEAARSHAKQQLEAKKPPGVQLVIL